MDKEKILSKYKNAEEKLLISKLFDKLELTDKTGKVCVTDFYNEMELAIVKNTVNLIGCTNYVITGGIQDSSRKLIVFFPEKMRQLFENEDFKYDTVFSVIRVVNPKENKDFFNHSVYLGGIIKLGISRQKIGDIVVFDDGADIIIKNESEKFLYNNLNTLTRFKSSNVTKIKLNEVHENEQCFKEFSIITSSLRLDSIVAELARTSRSKASDLLSLEKVFVNYKNEVKSTKLLKDKDIITIRGKGKFIISEISGNTKKGNYVLKIKQFL